MAEQARGTTPTGRLVIEGVLSWDEYCARRATWDAVRQCIGLDAEFYKGAELHMYPCEWLNRAELIAEGLRGRIRVAEAVGIDTGEGVANTVWTAVDRDGLIEQLSIKTRDTSVIVPNTIAFANKHGCPFEQVCFDRGGGGRQYADVMKAKGYHVRTVAFGEPVAPDPQRAKVRFSQKVRTKEDKYTYKDRRAQMAHAIRLLIEPVEDNIPDVTPEGVISMSQKMVLPKGFGIPAKYTELRRQMAPIPLTYDENGKMFLLPKRRKEGDSKEKKTLEDLLGCSPDEWDSFMVAVYAMQNRPFKPKAGAV